MMALWLSLYLLSRENIAFIYKSMLGKVNNFNFAGVDVEQAVLLF